MVGWDNCIPGLVMLDLGVGSSLVGGGEEVFGVVSEQKSLIFPRENIFFIAF